MDVQEHFLLIEHMRDAMRVAGHLVHVVRNRAKNAVQVGQLRRDLSGKLGAALKRRKGRALEVGRRG